MTEQQQERQHTENIQEAERNKKSLSLSINLNSLLTTVFGLAIMAVSSLVYGEIKSTHDTTLVTSGKIDTINVRLDNHDGQLKQIWDKLK